MKLTKKELDVEVWKQYRDTTYDVSNFGRCRHRYKSREPRIMTPYRKYPKRGPYYMLVKIDGKAVKLRTMIWETFKGPVPDDHCVIHRNKIPSITELSNLALVPRSELGTRYGGSTSQARLIYDIEKRKFYRGCRAAAKALYISRQTVCDICNGKVKKPMVRIRWATEDE